MKRLIQFVLLLAVLVCSVPVRATETMSQHLSNAACGNVSTCNVTGFSAVAAGSFIFGAAMDDAGGAITWTAGASGGGTWTVPSGCATQTNCRAANGAAVAVGYVLSSTGSPTTLSCTTTTAIIDECEIVVYRFTNGPLAFDVGTGGQNKSGANYAGVSAGTLTGTNDIIIQYAASQGSISGCPNSATNPNDFPNGHGVCGLVNSTNNAAGTYTNTTGSGAAGAIAFKETGGGGTAVSPMDKRRRYELVDDL